VRLDEVENPITAGAIAETKLEKGVGLTALSRELDQLTRGHVHTCHFTILQMSRYNEP
jgi:hypothetical protein